MTTTTEPRTVWSIVTQVKANRIVYYTDDPHYRPPSEGDWYYVSQHLGDLPAQMTAANCWGWRYQHGEFHDVREPDAPAREASLLESNRQALLGLLRDKIDRARAEWAPQCLLGAELRALKLQQAQAWLQHTPQDGEDVEAFDLLAGVASTQRVTMTEAARGLVERAAAMRRGLVDTERVREQLARDIREAATQDELLALRRRLLGDVLPALSREAALPVNPMTPEEWDEPLAPSHRVHEVSRLKARLREIVNARRRRLHDGYAENEVLLRHKARLAQALLDNGGDKPAGQDYTLLEGLAEAHGLTLADAARLAMGTISDAEAILRGSELLKDRLSARIERMNSLRDVQRVQKELDDANRSD